MVTTRAEAVAKLDAALAALAAATEAQSYSMGELSIQRAPIADLERQVQVWQRVVRAFDSQAAGVANPGAAFASFK